MDDLIRRKDAIEAFRKELCRDSGNDREYVISFAGCKRILNALPSVQERKGHDTGESKWFHCSECGYGVFDVYLDDEQKYDLEYHYCPNCGAKMEGAEDAGRNE